tara:strand:+ start:1373 stop:1843 length:471 start_codon:yes stop_codon:yes gene_type:complete
MSEKVGWDIFRAEYKIGLEAGEDMAKVIAESYDKCMKFGLSVGAAPPAPLVSGNVKALEAMLKVAFSSYGITPFPLQLDNGLKLYWLGGVTAAGASVIVPGVTAAFIPMGAANKDIDDFIEQLITAFKTHLGQISGAIPGAPPIPFVGYNVPDRGV